jgi:Phycobilisome protein
MTTRLRKLATAADGRYFTADERRQIKDYTDYLHHRLDAADAVEQKEEAVLRSVIEEMQKKYPNFAKYHDQGWARQFRDLQLVLRCVVHAMILDDLGQLDDRILFWMRTMFAANNYTPAFVRDCFTRLRDRLAEQPGGDHFELLKPGLDRSVEVLGDFPEPATPAV